MTLALSPRPGYTLSRCGLTIAPGSTFDAWAAIGEQLSHLDQVLQLAIGDWLNYGEYTFGEQYTQAVNYWPEAKYQTLANWKYVAGRVPLSLRKEKLYFSHYAAVAALPVEDRIIWLNMADKMHLSSRELAENIRAKADKPMRGGFDLADWLSDTHILIETALDASCEDFEIEALKRVLAVVETEQARLIP